MINDMLDKVIIGFIDRAITQYTNILLKYAGEQEPFTIFKNILSPILTMKNPRISTYLWIIDRYMRETGVSDKYFNSREAEYLLIDHGLTNQLIEEVKILSIHGVSDLASRILTVMANINRFELIDVKELTVYRRRIPEILSMPVPPWTDEGRMVDLLGNGDRVVVLPGSITLSWLIKGLNYYFRLRGIKAYYMVCSDPYQDYINRRNIHRVLKSINPGMIEFIDCSNSYGLARRILGVKELVVITSYYAILFLIDSMRNGLDTGSSYDNILLVFNPIDTPLEKVFRHKRQIVTRFGELINMFHYYK